MGMFDDELVPFGEHHKEDTLFTLEDAKVGNLIPTEYGPSKPAMLKIGGKWFSIFGEAMCNQIERMESGDLPRKVAVIRRKTKDEKREMKLLVTEAQLAKVREGEDIPF